MPRTSGPIRVLSVDGGGLRDVIPLEILKRLEAKTGQKIHDMFDMICGTSGGGLVALCVGMFNESLDVTSTVFDELSQKVFGGFHNNLAVEVVEAIFTGTAVPEKPVHDQIVQMIANSKSIDHEGEVPINVPMFQGSDVTPKVFVVTSDGNFDPYIIRNYASNPDVWTIYQAALATTAATGFFKPVSLTKGLKDSDKSTVNKFVDGGEAHAGNPIIFAVTEVDKLRAPGGPWEGRELGCLVSLGVGDIISPPSQPPTLTHKIIDALTPNAIQEVTRAITGVIDVVSDRTEEAVDFVKLLKEWEPILFRFQVPVPEKYSAGFDGSVVAPLRDIVKTQFDGKSVQKIIGQAGILGQDSISSEMDRLVAYLKAEDGGKTSNNFPPSAIFAAGSALHSSFRQFNNTIQPTGAHKRFETLLKLAKIDLKPGYDQKITSAFATDPNEIPNPSLPSVLKPVFPDEISFAAFKLGYDLERLVMMHREDILTGNFCQWWQQNRPLADITAEDQRQIKMSQMVQYLFAGHSKFWTGYWLLDNIASQGGRLYGGASKIAIEMISTAWEFVNHIDEFGGIDIGVTAVNQNPFIDTWTQRDLHPSYQPLTDELC